MGLFTMPRLKTVDSKKIIETYYADITGFGIAHDDEKHIIDCGGAPTYGEMTFEGVETLLQYLKPQKTDVFVDAGCGVGKLVVQFFFSTDVAKAVGIELSKERSEKAMSVKAALAKDGLLPSNRSLELYHADILDVDIHDATIFFMCSTCFSSELMQKITHKLSGLKPGLRVITLKELPETQRFVLRETLRLPMTWSSATSVYCYELI